MVATIAPEEPQNLSELDLDRIARAALAVADDRGTVGFTMRAVADELGVTPMALYHYVKDKAALAALLVDAAIRQQPLPESSGDWREDLWTIAAWMRDTTNAHPAVIHLRRQYHVWTPALLQITERWLSLWYQSGLSTENAMLAAKTSSVAINGLVVEEALFRTMQAPDASALSWLPNARAMFNRSHEPNAEFELVVRALIDGLHARLAYAN